MAKKTAAKRPPQSTGIGMQVPAGPLPIITNALGMELAVLPSGAASLWHLNKKRRPISFVQKATKFREALLVGVTPVTQSVFERVMGTNPSEFKGSDLPVDSVTWTEAVDFCRRLSGMREEQAEQRTYRLPSNLEWQYACLAGNQAEYGFGDQADELGTYAWFGGDWKANADAGNSGKTTHPVGTKRPNAWGLYDFHGNVYEWTSDCVYEHFEPSKVEYLLKGGSYYHDAYASKVSQSISLQARTRSSYVGFRVAAVPGTTPSTPT